MFKNQAHFSVVKLKNELKPEQTLLASVEKRLLLRKETEKLIKWSTINMHKLMQEPSSAYDCLEILFGI